MKPIIFQYRSRKLHADDIAFINALIEQHFLRGRTYISCELCKHWNWMQPNGKHKEYAARDLLLRLEEQGLVTLPPRIRTKNNLKPKVFVQTPLFVRRTHVLAKGIILKKRNGCRFLIAGSSPIFCNVSSCSKMGQALAHPSEKNH